MRRRQRLYSCGAIKGDDDDFIQKKALTVQSLLK